MSQKNPIQSISRAIPAFILLVILVISPKNAHASLFDDFVKEMNKTLQGGVDGVKNLVTSQQNKNTNSQILSLESNIGLAVDGDVNKNGQIDAGDTITFTYSIQNNTDKKYTYATLKTNVPRESLNFIRNISGVTGVKDDGKTLEFPNLRVEPGLSKVISFDATVNYFTDQDPLISTEPELIAEDKKSVFKSDKKQIQGKRIRKEDIPEKIQMFKKDKK